MIRRGRAAWAAVGGGLVVVAAAAGAFAADPAAAPGARLGDVEQERAKTEAESRALDAEARRLDQEAGAIAGKLVALAADARLGEQAVADLKDRLARLTREEREGSRALERQRGRLAVLLAALERIARNPPEALVAYAGAPRDAFRSAMLLRAMIPEIDGEASKLRASLDTLARLREDALARREALAREVAALDAKRSALNRLLDQKRTASHATRTERDRALARANALAEKARSLRDLVARLARERARERARRQTARIVLRPPVPKTAPGHPRAAPAGLPAAPLRPISEARGRLVRPVVGNIVVHFGDRNQIGGQARGLRVTTAAEAQVLAPYAGDVVFAGPFRGYGPLLIIDHGEGYHSLLAGLGRIDAAVGQKLLTGEPVGIMAPPGIGPHRLYIEMRRNGRPFDPTPWLAAPSQAR